MRNAISGKQLDSVQKETLVLSATGVIVHKKHSLLLLLQRRGTQTDEREPFKKAQAPGESSPSGKKCQRPRKKNRSKEIVRTRRVAIGILSCVSTTSLNQDANIATMSIPTHGG